MTIFVFLHVGTDPCVDLFVSSIRKSNPSAQLIQCSDQFTEQVSGVTEVYRHDGDRTNLMTFRLEAFYGLRLQEPAIYLDTDMLILGELKSEEILGEADVVCCKRSFNWDLPINTSFRGMDLSEYQNKSLGEVYPILAAFTVTRTFDFWLSCFNRLLTLDKKFFYWYGDQEAMRDVIQFGQFKVNFVPESKFSCLPEFVQDNSPKILHFKGAQRKAWMPEIFKRIYHAE